MPFNIVKPEVIICYIISSITATTARPTGSIINLTEKERTMETHVLIWARLADSSRRFLICALEAEIWVPLGGWHGGPKNHKKIFFQILSFFGQITYIEMFYDRSAQKMTIFGRFSRF